MAGGRHQLDAKIHRRIHRRNGRCARDDKIEANEPATPIGVALFAPYSSSDESVNALLLDGDRVRLQRAVG